MLFALLPLALAADLASLEADLAAFQAMEITLTPEEAASPQTADPRLGAQLSAKVQALRSLEKVAIEVYNQAEVAQKVEALRVIGLAYEDMADTLEASTVPAYLTADQAEIYAMTLGDRAYVQREKAVEAYKGGLEEAYAARLYTPSVLAIRERLSAIKPAEYPKTSELLPQDGRWPLTGEPAPSALLRGFEALEYGDFSAADGVFSAALARDPASPDAAIGLAVTRRGQRELALSSAIYHRALSHPVGCFNAVIVKVRYERDPVGARQALAACDMSGWEPELQDHLLAQLSAEIERARQEEAQKQAEEQRKLAEKRAREARQREEFEQLRRKMDILLRCPKLGLHMPDVLDSVISPVMEEEFAFHGEELPASLQREGLKTWGDLAALSPEDLQRLYCP